MEKRVHLNKTVPTLYQAMTVLNQQADEYGGFAGIAKGFAHLLKLRASQLNQCAYCVRLHTRDAVVAGESMDRVAVLAAWRESGYFTEKERAALALCEAVTFVAVGQVSDAVYAEATGVLSPEEIAAVEWLTVVINAWNRLAIASRYPVKP